MPRNRRLRDYLMRRDGRRGRRDRGMDYDYAGRDYRGGDYEYDSRRGDRAYNEQDNARGRRDYERGGQRDMAAMDYARGMRGRDGHYPMVQGYMPIEAMGRFTGYWGEPESDYARGGRGGGRGRDYNADYGYDYNYDMGYDYARRGGRRDYAYDMRYDYAGGMLTDEDLEEWSEKLKKEVEEKDKQFFSKEHLKKRADEMGIKFDKFSFEEFMVTALMMYTDYCKTLGTANMDLYLRLAKDWLCDEDVAVKYGDKLATYYDTIVDPQ